MINLDVFPHFITLAPPKSQSTFDCIVACSYKMHFLELAFAIMKFLLPSMGFKGNVFAAGFYWICHVMENSTKALCELKID